MLADLLSPIPFSSEPNVELSAECLALTFLAGYNDQAIPDRVVDSFERSFGTRPINFTPFVPNGNPGYLAAYWNTPDVRRVTVAFEGMRTFDQLRSFWNPLLVSAVAPFGGRVMTNVAAMALAIRDQLMANPTFTQARLRPGTQFILTGHSLGAMVAELLAEALVPNIGSRNMKVVKFGSPRIGTNAYVSSRNRLIAREGWYFNRDPVDTIPYFLVSSNTIDLIPVTGGPGCWLQRDPDAVRINGNGGFEDSFHVGGMVQAATFLRAFGQPRDLANPWFDHSIVLYRYGMTELCNRGSGLVPWRFRYVETPDENQWGVQFTPGGGVKPEMTQIFGGNSPQVVVEPRDLPRLNEEPLPAGDLPRDRSRREVGNFEDDLGGGGVWGEPVQPEVAGVQAIVAAPPATFDRITPNRRRTGRWSGAQGR